MSVNKFGETRMWDFYFLVFFAWSLFSSFLILPSRTLNIDPLMETCVFSASSSMLLLPSHAVADGGEVSREAPGDP